MIGVIQENNVLEKYMQIRRILNRPLKPSQIVLLSFLGVIVMGAILLMLPICTQTGEITPFVDTLFTSTSAVCVTGLVVVDTGTYWSIYGKTIILLLIQIGGLGFMTLTTSVAILFGKKIGLRNRIIMQEALNQFSLAGVIRLTRYVIFATLAIEGLGAFFLSTRFVPLYGWKNGLYYSIFHSVSAFCNAGFDIIGGYRGLMPFVKDPVVNITIMMLIVFGGLGFVVIADLSRLKKIREWSLHSKLVVLVTTTLIAFGFIFILALEFNNASTMKDLSLPEKVMAAMFQSITPRTAGYNTLDIAGLRSPTRFVMMLLMFIGGSPGSTAGGIKTTTFGLMILSIISVFNGSEEINFAKRRISKETINKALSVILISIIWIMAMILLLLVVENDKTFEQLSFEALSAFGTVGLSMGITPFLSVFGKLILALMMFFGRVGPLTVVIAISSKAAANKRDLLKYPEGKIIVG